VTRLAFRRAPDVGSAGAAVRQAVARRGDLVTVLVLGSPILRDLCGEREMEGPTQAIFVWASGLQQPTSRTISLGKNVLLYTGAGRILLTAAQ
jgi:hypothetical protein